MQGLDFADVSVVDGNQPNIDILIGSDFYFEILTGEVVRRDSRPVVVQSKFGWVLLGPTLERGEMIDMSMANLVIEKIGSQNPYTDNENDNELSCALRRFWDIESLGIQDEVDRTSAGRTVNFYPLYVFEKPKAVTKYSCPGKTIVLQNRFVSTAFSRREGWATFTTVLKFLHVARWYKERKTRDQQYQFRRLPFGLTPSPAILASTIRYQLSKYEEREPKIVSLLRDSFYVDDFAGGAYEDSEALQIYRTSKELMNKGGF